METALTREISEIGSRADFKPSDRSLDERIRVVEGLFSIGELIATQGLHPTLVEKALRTARNAVTQILAEHGDIEAAMSFNDRYSRLELAYRGITPTSREVN